MSGSLGRSAQPGGEECRQMHYLIDVFTANTRPMSLKSFYKFSRLRLQKMGCVYSQKEGKIDCTSVRTIGRDS